VTNVITEDHSFLSHWLIAICLTATSNETNITTRCPIVTRKFEQPKHTRNGVVGYENLRTIKPMEYCLKTAKLLTLSSLNCRSVKNKALSIADLVTSCIIDKLALTETWLGTYIDAQVLFELASPGYDILQTRPDKRRGGVAALFRQGSVLNIIQSTKDGLFTQCEHMELSVKAGMTQMIICIVYRPPPSGQNLFKATMFLDERSNYFDCLTTIPEQVIMTGDLYFHFAYPTYINVR